MNKVILALVVGAITLPITACKTFDNISTAVQVVEGVKITQNQLDEWVAAYTAVVLVPYNTYKFEDYPTNKIQRRYCSKAHPFSAADPCASYRVLSTMQPILASATVAEKNLQDAVTGCNTNGDQSSCSGLSGAKKAFDSAVTLAKATAISLGVI